MDPEVVVMEAPECYGTPLPDGITGAEFAAQYGCNSCPFEEPCGMAASEVARKEDY